MNWGFIGFGRIARKFLTSLNEVDDEVVYAFASRSNAQKLKEEFPDTVVYNSYVKLLNDPNVDVVYISTTHNFHCQNVIEALKAGKHVLCEKPMGVSSSEIREMIEAANDSGKFLMEAMWMRFLPAYREAIAKVRSGEIGETKYITANFGFRSESKLATNGRLLNPDLAGGALYDVGVYPLTIVSDLFGWKPVDFKAHAIKSNTGVDETIQVQFDFGANRMAQISGSFALETNKEACIYGEKGFIRMPLFWQAESYQIVKREDVSTFNIPFKSNGYVHEIEEVVSCIKKGKKESDLFSHQDSLESAQLVESILSTIFN